MIYDITPSVNEGLQVWPGDTRPVREVLLDMKRGDNLTLSTLHATVHLGAHADAASHYGVDAPSIDGMELDHYLGPCQVIHVDVARATRIETEAIGASIEAPRVLLATGTYPDPTTFNEDFAGLSGSLADHLGDRGVTTVGIDTPSVDLFDSKDLPAHRACLRRGIAILEGLVLSDVPEGVYELIALPLKLVGFDASPVRAILRA
ncbi:MAG: cyclase family protein [Phycisphaerae bacterium]